MNIRHLKCLHLTFGILLCLYVKLIFSAEANEEPVDEYIAYEGQRYDAFDWNLLKALGTSDFGNVIISPLSLKMTLAMVYEGSSGATEKELEQVLNFPSNKKDTKKKFQQILNSLSSAINDQALNMGSRVFMDSSIQAQQRYAAALKSFYDTDIKYVNFSNSTITAEEINYWISNVTFGHIKNLVEAGDLQESTLLFANALFFQGRWRTPFQKEKTHEGIFYITPKTNIQVSYMYVQAPLYYSDSIELDAKILRLPYQSGNIAMFILLPNSKAGLNRLINDLNPQALKRQIWIMDDQRNVNVYLPKFSFDFNARLGRILQELGLHHIFQNTASLAGIARGKGINKKLMVSNILQKCGIEVNEEGSTAYAASVITLVNKFGGNNEVNFNASHPFLFYIEDEFTGSVLFAGKVENPAQDIQPPFKENLNFPSRIKDIESSSTNAPGIVRSSGIR